MPQAIRITEKTLSNIEDQTPAFAREYNLEEKHDLISRGYIFVWNPVTPAWGWIIVSDQEFLTVYGKIPENIDTSFTYVYPVSLKSN